MSHHTTDTPEREAMTARLLDTWDTAKAVGQYSAWRDGDHVTVYFDGELPATLYPNEIGGGGAYRFVSVNSLGVTPTVTVEIQRYPEHAGGGA